MNNIKVSVIIPMHNAAVYVQENIKSLLAQTMDAFELIYVDDGSTDESVQVVKQYAQSDDRIVLLQQEQLSAGAARNRGIKAARGEYMLFIDADDFVQPDLLEETYNKASETQADIVLFGARKFDQQSREYIEADYLFRPENIPAGLTVFNRDSAAEKLYQITTPAPWSKLFRRAFILEEGIEFQRLPNSNDAYFVLIALAAAQRISFVNKKLVNYRVGRADNTQSNKIKNPTCFISAYLAVFKELECRGLHKQLERSYTNIMVSGCNMNLETVADPDAQQKIRSALASREFLSTGILSHPFDYYDSPMAYYRVRLAVRSFVMEYYAGLKEQAKKNPQEQTCKVSVIVPAYNSESYLRECLDSLKSQTMKDIEIICVNDGSTDGSLAIFEEYARCDERIRIIDQINMGLGAARNIAMLNARGEYISFIDSDDMFKPEALEYLYKEAAQNQLDVLFYDAESFYESEALEKAHPEFKTAYTRKRSYDETMTGTALFTVMRKESDYSASAPLQMVRREYVLQEDIDFPIGIYYEDNLFTMKNILRAKRASHRKAALYLRRVRDNSIMTHKLNFHNFYSYFLCYQEMVRFMENMYLPKETEEMIGTVLNTILRNFSNYYMGLPGKEKKCLEALPFGERRTIQTYVLPIVEQTAIESAPEYLFIKKLSGGIKRRGMKLMGKALAYMPVGCKRMIKRIMGRR